MMNRWWLSVSKNRVVVILCLILGIQTGLLAWSAKVHSPTWDEPGHMVAGLSHWKFGRFDLYSVNPPLVRVIATAPVHFFMNPKVDWSLYSTNPIYRTEVGIGRAFMNDNGSYALTMFFVARLMLIPVALAGSMVCFWLGRRLLGSDATGLSAAALFAFMPDSLAYGSLISPDMSTAVAGLAAVLCWVYFLEKQTASRVVLLSVVTCIAMLTKSIWLVLPAVYCLSWGVLEVLQVFQRKDAGVQDGFSKRVLAGASVSLVASLFLVNVFYGFQGSGKPLGKYQFCSSFGSGAVIAKPDTKDSKTVSSAVKLTSVSASVASPPCCEGVASGESAAAVCESCNGGLSSGETKVIQDGFVGNRFAGTLLGFIPVPLPSNYVQGMDVQRLDFERGLYRPEWKSYLAGVWQQGGWWYFYAVGVLFKTPVLVLVLCLLSPFVCWRMGISKIGLQTIVCVGVMASVVFVMLSVNSSLNRFLRYGLPVMPFLVLMAAVVVGACFSGSKNGTIRSKSEQVWGVILGSLMMSVFMLNSFLTGPHWLSSFNSLAGGSERGSHWFTDSNVDWGQDLLFLKDWLDKHPEASKDVRIAFFGSYSPSALGIRYQLPPGRLGLNSVDLASRPALGGPVPGWYVVSKNYLVGHPMPLIAPTGELVSVKPDSFTYFNLFEPVAHIGHSMVVFKLEPDQVDVVRSSMGIPTLARGRVVPGSSSAVLPTEQIDARVIESSLVSKK